MALEPKALRRGPESWELVVEKLVRVGPNYYKARRQCVRGETDILKALHRLNEPELFEDAKRAMEGPPKAYQITHGRLETADAEPEHRSESGNDTLQRVVRHCARLESRIEALENALRSSKPRQERPSAPVPRAGSVSSAPAEPTPPRSDSPSADESVSSRPPQRNEDLHEPSSSDAPTDSEAEAPAPKPPSSDPRLTFPDASALGRAYADLIGEAMALSDMPVFSLDEGVFYKTDLLDESDEVVGALILDLRATVFQAGALTMLEQDAREAMFESGEPSADALDAMKELLDAQSRCINSLPGNPHLRIGSVRRLDPGDDPWVFSPEHASAVRDPFEGRMLFVSR